MQQSEDGRKIFSSITETGQITISKSLLEDGRIKDTEVAQKTKLSSIGLSIQETPALESSIGISIQETFTKASSVGMTVVARKTKTSSVGISIQETFTKASSIGLSIQETPALESSIGIFVEGVNTKESSIGISIEETHIKESSIGITIVTQKIKNSIIGMYVFGANIKESSLGITIARRVELEKGTGTFIFGGISEDGRIEISRKILEDGNFRKAPHLKTKESSIGLSIQETPALESSIGISIQETFTKASSVGMTVVARKTKTSSVGISIQETFTKASSLGVTVIEPILKRGFFYAKLGDTILYGNIEDSFRILKEINRTPSFEFEIANCDENRSAINTGGGINMDFKIYWQHHGVDTLWFTGLINADGIEYVSLDSIRITGFASYVKLSWPIFKHLANEDKESVNTALTYNGSYFDKTTPINNATINDVAISFGGANHAFYIGENQPFWGTQIKYSTKGIPVEGTVVAIEYSTAAGWRTLDVLDETEAFTEAPGTYNLIIPHPPGDWVRKVVNGIKKCWMRYRIVSGSYNIEPKLDQGFIANVDIYRTYYFDTPANEILADVLEGTEYEEDLVDTCPTDVISIVAEYESPLRLIAAIPNALTWTDTGDDNKKKEYQWWIDDAKKVHMKQRRGETFDEDITGEMTIFNNHEDYFHLANRLIGLGPRDGLSQMRAIVQNVDSKETYGLREIAVSEDQIGKYEMLKNLLEKKIAISKDPMQRIRGSVSTQFWGRKAFEVGDTVTLHQEKWHVPEKAFQIVKVDIGPSITTLDLGISQDHLEGLRDDVQRQLNLNNVRMHGSTTLLEAGPETHNYQRVDAETVYPAKLEIDIPSTVKKIHKVFLSWTIGPYRASTGPQTGELPAHDHEGHVGDDGGYDSFDAGPDGAFTPDVGADGAFTPQMIGGIHAHLTETNIILQYNTVDIGILADPEVYPDSGKVNGGSHKHSKGRTGPPDDIGDAVTSLNYGCDCSAACGGGNCVTGVNAGSFAENTHWHFNSNLDTGFADPSMYVNVFQGTLITGITPYAFSETSNDESPEHEHEGVSVNAHDHAGVAVGDHSGHTIPALSPHGIAHTIVATAATALDIFYAIHEEAAGTVMELKINGELTGETYEGDQTEIRIDGWLNTGKNTIALQPIVTETNKKGGATLSTSGLLFIEPVKF